MSEAAYRLVTYDLTIAAATALADVNPHLTFGYFSGQGTDSTERGRMMWARVKGATENRLLEIFPTSAHMFRAGFIQPRKGTRSSVRLYRWFYVVTAPLFPVLGRLFPRLVTTTMNVGQAMIRVALDGYSKPILDTHDINRLVEEE
jgi:hypothetical protein